MSIQFTIHFVSIVEQIWHEDVFVITDNYSLDNLINLRDHFNSEGSYGVDFITSDQKRLLHKIVGNDFCDKFFGDNPNSVSVMIDFNDIPTYKKTFHSVIISGNKTR
jgi:hypothetical protein